MSKINKKIIKNMIHDFIIEECDLSDNAEVYKTNNKYLKYDYFGNCINTIPSVWNATQMSNWLYKCDILIDNNLESKLRNGERTMPKRLLKLLEKYLITDFEHFICGIDDYQKIMFIYSVDADIHYFFDCVK